MECFSENMRLLPFSLVIANDPFGCHGPWWRIVVLCSVGNVPSWKRTQSAGLSSVRSNSWTTGHRRAGSAVAGSAAASSSGAGTDGATSTASRLLFSGLPSKVSSSPAVVVTKNLRILLVSATALSSRRFFTRFLQHRRHTSADVYPTDTSQWSWTRHLLIAADIPDTSASINTVYGISSL